MENRKIGIVINNKEEIKKAVNILKSVLGQMSDGLWENTNSAVIKSIWKTTNIDNDDKCVYIEFEAPSIDNGWVRNLLFEKDNVEIKKYFATKIKQIFQEEYYYYKEELGKWKRDNNSMMKFIGDCENQINVMDAYKLYDRLLQRDIIKLWK